MFKTEKQLSSFAKIVTFRYIRDEKSKLAEITNYWPSNSETSL